MPKPVKGDIYCFYGPPLIQTPDPRLGSGLSLHFEEELEKSPTGRSYANGPGGATTRVIKVEQGDMDEAGYQLADVAMELLGFAWYASGASRLLSRYLPQVEFDPPYTQVCTRITNVESRGNYGMNPPGADDTVTVRNTDGTPVDSIDGTEMGQRFRTHFFTCEFTKAKYDILGDDELGETEIDRFVVWEVKPNVQYLSVPGRTCVWAGGPGKPAGDVPRELTDGLGFVKSTHDIRAQWIQVPGNAIDRVNLGDMLGSVNLSEFTLPVPDDPMVCDPETLLLQAIDYGPRQFFADGSDFYNPTFNFKYNPTGFNTALYPGDLTWYPIKAKASLNSLFPKIDFAVDLFRGRT